MRSVIPATWYSGDPVSFSERRCLILIAEIRSFSSSHAGAETESSPSSGSSMSPTFTIKSSGAGSSTSLISSAASAKRGLEAMMDLVFCRRGLE